MHIGTFPSSSSPSRFIAATNKLDYLKSLGINAIEVMPVAEFGNANSSEGYDPAQPFAVDNVQYGGPDAFKTFVIACHARGLAVLLDVVHNHYGTGDLDMWDFDGFAGTNSQGGGGIYFFQTNVNLQITPYGATRPNFNSQQVDNYVSNNIVMWLSEYHVDGFRWDDPYTLTHDNAGNYIPNAGNLLNGINNMTHANYPGKISIAEDVIDTWGFDSSWDTGYPSYFTPVLTNTVDANRNMNLVTYAIQNDISYSGFAAGFGRVVYLESHDVVYGPNGGERLVTAIASNAPSSYRARKLSTLGATVTLTAPGVPMIYQGQEMLESNAFYSYTPLDWTKTNTYSGIVQLYRDLITARRDLKGYTPGLEGDQCSVLWSDNTSKLVAFHRWKSGTTNQDAVVIANFANVNYNNGYNLNFPYAGTWYVHFNTDSTNYSSDFGNNGSTVVTASGNPADGQRRHRALQRTDPVAHARCAAAVDDYANERHRECLLAQHLFRVAAGFKHDARGKSAAMDSGFRRRNTRRTRQLFSSIPTHQAARLSIGCANHNHPRAFYAAMSPARVFDLHRCCSVWSFNDRKRRMEIHQRTMSGHGSAIQRRALGSLHPK